MFSLQVLFARPPSDAVPLLEPTSRQACLLASPGAVRPVNINDFPHARGPAPPHPCPQLLRRASWTCRLPVRSAASMPPGIATCRFASGPVSVLSSMTDELEAFLLTWVQASRKGGCGKTTITAHLAVAAALTGLHVAIADYDPQAGLAGWFNARREPLPGLAFADASSGIQRAWDAASRSGTDLLLVDTEPGSGDSIVDAVALADIVIVPCQASPNDLRAVGGTVRLVAEAGKSLVFVINRVKPRVRLTHQASSALSQHGTVAPVLVGDRTDFASSMTGGLTAMELDPKSKSAGEIGALLEYLRGRSALEASRVVKRRANA
jgi:chromosome partitioning protein